MDCLYITEPKPTASFLNTSLNTQSTSGLSFTILHGCPVSLFTALPNNNENIMCHTLYHIH